MGKVGTGVAQTTPNEVLESSPATQVAGYGQQGRPSATGKQQTNIAGLRRQASQIVAYGFIPGGVAADPQIWAATRGQYRKALEGVVVPNRRDPRFCAKPFKAPRSSVRTTGDQPRTPRADL